MATNLTVESPNFEKIQKEAGNFTADAISLLWQVLNATRADERRDFRRAVERMTPKVLFYNATGAVNNLDLQGAGALVFTGTTAQNFTGIRCPETNEFLCLPVFVAGSGTITIQNNNAGSQSQNQIQTTSGGNKVLAQHSGVMLMYVDGQWHEVL